MTTTILTVDVTDDQNDGPQGGLSLRDAVLAANTDGTIGAEFVIELAGGSTQDLSIQGSGEDAGNTGDLDILGGVNITIRSTGAPATIDAGGFIPLGDRIFDVLPGASLTLEGVEITGGSVAASGGGIVNAGALTLNNSTVSGNSALYNGGGIFSYDGSLTIVESTIADNTTNVREFAFDENMGGGIYASTDLTITNSTISGNSSESGGGIFITGSGSVEISASTLSANFSYDGGGGGIGITGSGSVAIAASTITDNTAAGDLFGGGGISAGGSPGALLVEISDSTVVGNTAAGAGGGGVVVTGDRTVGISTSTISDNFADAGGGGIGTFNDSTLILSESLVSGNATNSSGGGVFNGDSGITDTPVTIISNTTIANNTADADNNGEGGGGGIAIGFFDPLTLINSTVLNNAGGGILSGNTDSDSSGFFTLANSVIAFSTGGSDFAGNLPAIFGRNIVADNSLASFLEGVEPVDPATLLFTELQDNGGPTATFLPLAGNPVIDFGDNTFLSEQGFFTDPNFDDDPAEADLNRDGDLDDVFSTDQRGFDRIANGTVDLGAAEFGAGTEPEPNPDFSLDVDTSGGEPDALTDGLNVLRVLLGAPEASIVLGDNIPAGVTQATVAASINAARETLLDVDGNGSVEAATDGLNVLRVLLGAPEASIVLGENTPADTTQGTIVAAIQNLF